MMKFALLASGSKGNCCLIKSEQAKLIVDCGTTKRYLQNCFDRLSYDVKQSDALLITHTHKDHVSQLKMMEGITTYANAQLDCAYNKIEPYTSIVLKDVKITALPLSHDCQGTIGYMIETLEEKLVYITDTGYVRNDVLAYIENADYYIFESNHNVEMLMQTNRPVYVKQRIINDLGHLCNEDSAQALTSLVGDKTKEIVLAHISQEGNTPQLALDTLYRTFQKKDLPRSSIQCHGALQFDIYRGGKLE